MSLRSLILFSVVSRPLLAHSVFLLSIGYFDYKMSILFLYGIVSSVEFLHIFIHFTHIFLYFDIFYVSYFEISVY